MLPLDENGRLISGRGSGGPTRSSKGFTRDPSKRDPSRRGTADARRDRDMAGDKDDELPAASAPDDPDVHGSRATVVGLSRAGWAVAGAGVGWLGGRFTGSSVPPVVLGLVGAAAGYFGGPMLERE